jgi:putative acetyltransferase
MASSHSSIAKPFVIRPARLDEEVRIAGCLFREYGNSLGIDLSFQNFEAELAEMPGKYTPPEGELLLAWRDEFAIGCLGIRPLAEAGCCEFKRLYVRAEGRGTGVGRALAQAGVDWATAAGYTKILLDTMATMDAAIALYIELGFEEISAYSGQTRSDLRFFAKHLGAPVHAREQRASNAG